MKLIHSFWSKPSFHGNQDYENSRKFGGWLSYKYFLLSTCFSCLTLKKHNKKLDLYTDDQGAKIFIDQLNLPYNNVSLILNELSEADHRLWVLGKLKVIKCQDNPFIHVDNDVFTWSPLIEPLKHASIVAQSKHLMPSPYKRNLSGVLANFNHIPSSINKIPAPDATIDNIGIIGGTNIKFFQEYCDTAYNFLEMNESNLGKINIGGFNQILDEYLFTCLAKEKGEFVHYFINNINYDNPNIETYEHVLRFHMTPIIDKYIHVVGIAKQNGYACEQLELRLKHEFPVFYDKIMNNIAEYYPNLLSNYDNSLLSKERHLNVLKGIAKLYSYNVNDITREKIVLSEEIKVIQPEHGNLNEPIYLSNYNDPITGEQKFSALSGSDLLLTYFTSPISIDELIESLIVKEGPLAKHEVDQLKQSMISFSLEKIIISGQLRFCNNNF